MSSSSRANWAEPAADGLVWEQRDSGAAQVFTARTEGSRFLDCRVITLSPSSMTASSSTNPPWNRRVNFSREKHKEMLAGWIAFQGWRQTPSDTMVAIKLKVKGPENNQTAHEYYISFLQFLSKRHASSWHTGESWGEHAQRRLIHDEFRRIRMEKHK